MAQSYQFNFSVTQGLGPASISGALISADGGFITNIVGGSFTGNGYTAAPIESWVWAPTAVDTPFDPTATPFFHNSANIFGTDPALRFMVDSRPYYFGYDTSGNNYGYYIFSKGSPNYASSGGGSVTLSEVPEIDGNTLPKGLLLILCLYLVGFRRAVSRTTANDLSTLGLNL